MICIRSKTDGFRRCGVAHSASWQEYEDDCFSPEELEILKGEPMLQVLVGEAAETASVGAAGGYTNKKLAAILDRMGVEIPRGAKKADLEALIDTALATPAPAPAPNGQAGPANPGEGGGPAPSGNGQEE